MIWNWTAHLACGHDTYGRGRETYPSRGDWVFCPGCKHEEEVLGVEGQNW